MNKKVKKDEGIIVIVIDRQKVKRKENKLYDSSTGSVWGKRNDKTKVKIECGSKPISLFVVVSKVVLNKHLREHRRRRCRCRRCRC